jgi:hypothetical protein
MQLSSLRKVSKNCRNNNRRDLNRAEKVARAAIQGSVLFTLKFGSTTVQPFEKQIFILRNQSVLRLDEHCSINIIDFGKFSKKTQAK